MCLRCLEYSRSEEGGGCSSLSKQRRAQGPGKYGMGRRAGLARAVRVALHNVGGSRRVEGGSGSVWTSVKTLVGMVWVRQRGPGRWGAGPCPQPGSITRPSPGLVAQPGGGEQCDCTRVSTRDKDIR